MTPRHENAFHIACARNLLGVTRKNNQFFNFLFILFFIFLFFFGGVAAMFRFGCHLFQMPCVTPR